MCLTHEHLWTRNVILCTGVVDRRPVLSGIDESPQLICCVPVRCATDTNSLANASASSATRRHFSQNVWFVEIAGGKNEPHFDAAIMARLRRLPGLAQHVAVSQDHKAFVTMDDGSGHRFDVLYVALGVDPRTQLAAPLGAPSTSEAIW